MGYIDVTVALSGAVKQSRGFVNTELEDVVREIKYVIPGKLILSGRFFTACVPDDKLEQFRADLGDDYQVACKHAPSAEI